MNYGHHADGNRRLAILKILLEEAGTSNASVIDTALREIGHRAGLERNVVHRLITDLEERDCVTTQMVRDTVKLVTITPRGRMAVRGDVVIEGIASPHHGL